ncbi:MAG TPA: FtsX-like permease family protein [Terriglobales bacterium]|nr:FtsX-like permease family protein [Terriglobales bacterium]
MSARRGGRGRMFLRLIWRAALVRRGRALTALVAVAVAAAVATTLLNLYADSEAKLRREFRKFGANVVVVAREGNSLPDDALARVEKAAPGALAVPFAYVVAKAGTTSVVVAGTNLPQAREMNRWWSLTPGVGGPGVSALVGERVMKALNLRLGAPFALEASGQTRQIAPAQVVETGGPEDNRIFVNLNVLEEWTGVRASTIEVAVSGTRTEIESAMQRIQKALPEADVRPIRQIQEGEARVLGKTRAALLAATILVIVTATLCVLATLMSWVLDRRRDFAVMKALGASERLLRGFFAAEAGLIGALGAVVGYAVGLGAALWIGRVNFEAAVSPRLSVFPPVLAGGVLVALIAALAPLAALRRIQPAVILRGE